MNKKLQFQGALLLAGMAVAALTPMAARSAPPVPSGVTVTVTAVGKKDAPPRAVKKDDVQLYQGKERKQVANWRRGETLFIAVLIDDSLRSSIANQWNDLRAFLMAQPPTTYIAVAYARNGTAMVAQDFTTDHALAAKAIRRGNTICSLVLRYVYAYVIKTPCSFLYSVGSISSSLSFDGL